MAKFEDLWTNSQMFRQLFLLNGVFESVNKVDLGKAEVLWFYRYPRVEWGFCDVDGCASLVPKGQVCPKHIKESPRMPRWKWNGGILYRYFSKKEYVGDLKRSRSEYIDFRRYQANKIWGGIPDGYSVYTSDGNPFNLHRTNLILLSDIATVAVKGGVLKIPEAVTMDDVLESYIKETFRRGRPKSQWVYTFEAIAQVAGVRAERARQAVSRRQLDPSKLESIVEFCHACRETAGNGG
jgi:hypothetical protein